MSFINSKILKDLEIFEKIVPKLDHTVTIYGKTKFKELFTTMQFEPELLFRRQDLLKTILRNSNTASKIRAFLEKISKLQSSINWLFQNNDEAFQDLYFQKEFLNIKELLTAKNFLKIYSPSLTIIIYIIIYIILKYNRVPVSINNYLYGIYQGYKLYITLILNLIVSGENFISFLTNILATTYVFYQFYSIYNSFEFSISHYQKCDQFKDKFIDLKKFVKICRKIYKLDTFLYYEKTLIRKNLISLNKLLSDNNLNSLGFLILFKKRKHEYEGCFNKILQYISLVDSFLSISLLVRDGYSFPQFDIKSQKPYIMGQGFWYPGQPKSQQVLNDCKLGTPNSMIITGPNTAGKSTYLRNVMLSILLSQTLGVCASQELIFTPFYHLFTYLDIPNVAGNKESLFEAEILRCMDYCKVIEKLSPNLFAFTIMDEIFTGTNPKEGISGSYSVCDYLGTFENSLNIITTHFGELTKLADLYPQRFKNMKFSVIEKQDGRFYRPFKLEDGRSDQHIAIKLLKQKGYNNRIIDGALNKLQQLNTV